MSEGWFDIHNHAMPDVDDGAHNLKESNRMLKAAYEEGIRSIILTPHCYPRFRETTPDELKEKHLKLQKLAHMIDRSFEIYLGNEIYYQHDVAELLHNRKIQTMAGSDYVLVEFSLSKDFRDIKNGLYELQMAGYLPILAHIERYKCFEKTFNHMVELEEMGVYLQVNASSVIGNNGLATKRFVKQALDEELVHFIATDAHGIWNRPPLIKKCVHYVSKKYGSERAGLLFYQHPMDIIKNRTI